jgi:hypothetical protein
MSHSLNRLRIVVLGYIVRGPVGGMAWHHLQYVLGLKSLGHDVLFIEDSDDFPSCYDPSRHVVDCNPEYGLRFTKNAFDVLGMDESWAYYDAYKGIWRGPGADVALKFCSTADLAINVSGVNPLRPWTLSIARRAFIDTDPLFTQVRHLNDAGKRQLAENHTHHFTFGECIGSVDCVVPDDGFVWTATRQPVALNAWRPSGGSSDRPFTTVMQWDSYPSARFAGATFGMKSESFRRFTSLPGLVAETLEIALGGHAAPRDELRASGWQLTDPLDVAIDPRAYQRYIAESKAEFSVAKHGYVKSRCGWFSERSACYLASGRPVVVQDTGFSRFLPTGRGLLAFSDIESAAAAVGEVAAHYGDHCQAAREICEAYFDSGDVLSLLLEKCMND